MNKKQEFSVEVQAKDRDTGLIRITWPFFKSISMRIRVRTSSMCTKTIRPGSSLRVRIATLNHPRTVKNLHGPGKTEA
jgi:hypothetical protein